MNFSRVARTTMGCVALVLATMGCSQAEDKLAAGPTTGGGVLTATTAAPDISSIPVDPAFCAALNTSSGALTGGTVEVDAAAQLTGMLDALRSTAPSVFAADIELVTATLAQVAPMLTASSLPTDMSQVDPENADAIAAQMSALGAHYRALEDPRFQAALARLSAYSEQKCG